LRAQRSLRDERAPPEDGRTPVPAELGGLPEAVAAEWSLSLADDADERVALSLSVSRDDCARGRGGR